MLSPDCEAEIAPPLVRDLGRHSISRWQAVYPGVVRKGSLVVASGRDRPELKRFAAVTENHRMLDHASLKLIEPTLADRFDNALYFEGEAHMAAPQALAYLLAAVRSAGVVTKFGETWPMVSRTRFDPCGSRVVIDCRGYAARDDLPELRGVRGERILIHAPSVGLTRPVRLLHPRISLYVVPWPGDIYMVGATLIESSDAGPMTLRSALELLGAAYALSPQFGEATIVEFGAGVRPALPDNIPRVIVRDGGATIHVNGAYRHGFLLAPILAEAVQGYLAGQADHPLLTRL